MSNSSDAPHDAEGEALTRLSWHRKSASDTEHLAHRDALVAAVYASAMRDVTARVWPDGHLGSCPRHGEAEDDPGWWCDCGYSLFIGASITTEGT